MSPSIITEANQPLPTKSTVAQRKQANELRKVRRNINDCFFLKKKKLKCLTCYCDS